jgi:hypothetical protein
MTLFDIDKRHEYDEKMGIRVPPFAPVDDESDEEPPSFNSCDLFFYRVGIGYHTVDNFRREQIYGNKFPQYVYFSGAHQPMSPGYCQNPARRLQRLEDEAKAKEAAEAQAKTEAEAVKAQAEAEAEAYAKAKAAAMEEQRAMEEKARTLAQKQQKEKKETPAVTAQNKLPKERLDTDKQKQEELWKQENATTLEQKQASCQHAKIWSKTKQIRKIKCQACHKKRGVFAFECPYCTLSVCQLCQGNFVEKKKVEKRK